MKTLQRTIPTDKRTPRNHWVKIYIRDPYSVQILGPFPSNNEAQDAQERYTKQLESEGQKVVSCFNIAPISNPVTPHCPMSHAQWLQGLMEDYLHVKVP